MLMWRSTSINTEQGDIIILMSVAAAIMILDLKKLTEHILHTLRKTYCTKSGLKINIAQTKVIVVDNIPINVYNVLIEHIEGYVC